jgi:type II secretory pathway pseudopilin PulG
MKERADRWRNEWHENGGAERVRLRLLLVFVMAAAIAITLYIEVPRIAFESQRTREQMAIDRALQYKRAIQLFYRKYQTYPQTLDDLETTRNIRFLRRRYWIR